MDLARLQSMIDGGYVHFNKHPSKDLYIYNYTPYAQYERMWNEVTLQCRGLIMDSDYNVVARPLPKFFNLEELEPHQIPNEPFEVYEKLDGSLGILYFQDNQPFIASRGSFNSPQSQKANEILVQKYQDTFKNLNKNYTYIFEIIYPENRIVVDYGTEEALILLAIVKTATGQDMPLVDIGFPIAKSYDGISDFKELKALEEDNREGFVVKFQSGFRMKVKFEEYKRLHYIMANVSNKSIWMILSEGKSLDEMLHLVPDEFYNWVKKTEQKLRSEFAAIENIAKSEYKILDTRKATAMYFKTCTHPGILFSMLDGKDYSDTIWRMIKPDFERPFLHQQEEELRKQ